MNVLIYDGLGTSKLSLKGAHATLSALLSPYYSIRYISAASLLTEPWTATTALLVIPGGRDLPYCAALDGDVTRKVDEYIRRGGRYLGLCAGAYFASRRVEFEVGSEIEVQGPRELPLWRGIARGCAFPGFVYDSELGARSANLRINRTPSLASMIDELQLSKDHDSGTDDEQDSSVDKLALEIYWNGGGIFVDAEHTPGVEVIASYEEPVKIEGGAAAVISLAHGKGRVVLSAVHPEISLKQGKTSQKNGRLTDTTSPETTPLSPLVSEIKATPARGTADRILLLRMILHDLGLQTNEEIQTLPKLSTLYLLAYSDRIRTSLVDTFKSLADKSSEDLQLFESDTDTFAILDTPLQRPAVENDERDLGDAVRGRDITYICVTSQIPHFPMFDAAQFFAILRKLHNSPQSPSKTLEDPIFGSSLLYGEIVTSSQSLLDGNFSLQRKLPNGFTILCSHQLAGRGRGQNSWTSPPGVLSFSTILYHTPAKSEAPGSIVFMQYLVSLAVSDAILQLRPSLHVRIKWPNDVYLEVPSSVSASGPAFTVDGKKFAKVSGSLISTSWTDGKYALVIGIGINVSNPHPTVSLNSVLPASDVISLEELFATVLVTFASYYQRFVAAGATFGIFQERYYELWLHTAQKVTIDAISEQGTVEGISCQDGTLRVATKRGVIGLQADGNSFDMLKGLLKVKI